MNTWFKGIFTLYPLPFGSEPIFWKSESNEVSFVKWWIEIERTLLYKINEFQNMLQCFNVLILGIIIEFVLYIEAMFNIPIQKQNSLQFMFF